MQQNLNETPKSKFFKDSKILNIIQVEKEHLYDYLDDWASGSVHVVKGVSIFVFICYILYLIIYLCWYGELDFNLYYLVPILIVFSVGFVFEYLLNKGHKRFIAKYALLIMHCFIVALCFYLDCFTDSTVCQIYVPFVLAVGPIIFLLSIKQEIFMNTITLIVYLIVANLGMTPIPKEHAIIQGCIAYLIGMMCVFVIANMRYTVLESTNELNKEVKAREKVEYASEVAEALSYDFLNVFSIDFKNKTVRIIKLDGYVTDGFDKDNKEVNYPYEKMINTYIDNRVHPDEREKLRKELTIENVEKQLKTQRAYIGPYRVLDDHGEHYYQFRYVRIGDTDKVIAGFRNVDTTMRYNNDQKIALKEALVAANQASEAKSQFLNSISHDVRTPMNAIMGSTSKIEANKDNPEVIEQCVTQINESSQQLLKYVDGILDMTRSNKEVSEERKSYSLNKLVNELVAEIKVITEPKHINVTVDTSEVINDMVQTNKDRFHQVMYAVLENAALYTQEGGNISFTVRQGSKLSSGKNRYVFKVKDDGVGMSEDFLQHLFDPFSREKDTTHSGIAGAGLGLLTAKNILESTGGGIVVQSKHGEGTEVTMVAMLYGDDKSSVEKSEVKNDNYTDVSNFKGMHVLVIDDNELNREIAVDVLTTQGLIAEAASSGKEAIEKIKSSSLGYYKAILMDIMMPEMDGFETTKQVRALERIDVKNIPIIALSANANTMDSDKALAEGMNGFITKPFQVNDFIEVIKKFYN